jgi:ABC-2 type transport system permease protein
MRQYEYRYNNLLWFFCGLVPAVVSYISWITVYGDKAEINGFSKESIFPYFVVMTILWYFVGGTVSRFVGEHIKGGGLNAFLIKPIHPIVRYIFIEQGWKLGSLAVVTPLSILIFILFDFPIQIISIWQIVALVFSIIFAAIIFSLWDLIIGMTAFFIDDISPVGRLNRVLFSLMSGQIYPLALLPVWITKFNDLFFFRYTFAFPSEIIFTPESIDYTKMFSIQIIWVLILIIAFNLIYKTGIKRYEAYGA